MIDFRSDTVTRPSPEMLKFMLKAEIGDDVYGEDPTVKKLEEKMAEMAGKEAAVFAPSGTMSNLMGILAHCQRGDEYIVGQTAHTYLWEGGGAAVLGSVQPQPLDFEIDGSLDLEKVESVIKPIDYHHARTKLFCLENTVNGRVLALDYLKKIKPFCEEKKLASHLDGARVFNACIKLGLSLKTISENFDSISICLSKGLGAPIGSVLCGTSEFIREARHWRKMLGGGMRQAGILAAAGIYALEHNISRLEEDHQNAAFLGAELEEIPGITVDKDFLQTNILYATFGDRYAELQKYLRALGIIIGNPRGKSGLARLIIHLDISRNDIKKFIEALKNFYK